MTAEGLPSLTIVLPTYNEAENLVEFIPQIEDAFAGVPFSILVVDDDSPDGTADVARRQGEIYGNVSVLTPPERRGLGAALRLGYSQADSDYILSSDADLSFSVEDMRCLFDTIRERGADLVQGTRHQQGGHYAAPSLRIAIKKAFSVLGNFVVRHIASLPVTDCSANFRVIRRDAWLKIETQENTNAILFEMIFKCHHGGLRVSSIPVSFVDRRYGQSKLNLMVEIPKFVVRMFYYVLRYRFTGYRLRELPEASTAATERRPVQGA